MNDLLYHENHPPDLFVFPCKPKIRVGMPQLQGKLSEFREADEEGVDSFGFRVHVAQLV